jgi:hypothetical protein
MKITPPTLFFRDDDLGWDQPSLKRMLDIFKLRNHKLNAAAIPTECQSLKLTASDFKEYKGSLEISTHGFAHQAHSSIPKKSEYAPDRSTQEVLSELWLGKEILSVAFDELYFPAFTPPWNRIDDKFLPALSTTGYRCLSRYGQPQSNLINEINVTLDLHTDKKNQWQNVELIGAEIERQLQTNSRVGIMLHHCKMSDKDFDNLDLLLQDLNAKSRPTFFFSELVKENLQ